MRRNGRPTRATWRISRLAPKMTECMSAMRQEKSDHCSRPHARSVTAKGEQAGHAPLAKEPRHVRRCETHHQAGVRSQRVEARWYAACLPDNISQGPSTDGSCDVQTESTRRGANICRTGVSGEHEEAL
jgi:hypothetical protein